MKLQKVSENILIQKGIRQGVAIALKMFTTVLEKILKNLEWKEAAIKMHMKKIS